MSATTEDLARQLGATPLSLFAYFIGDENSFMAVMLDDTWFPLVFASKERALSPEVVAVVNQAVSDLGKPARLVEYRRGLPLAEITPET